MTLRRMIVRISLLEIETNILQVQTTLIKNMDFCSNTQRDLKNQFLNVACGISLKSNSKSQSSRASINVKSPRSSSTF
jgi:hypothetical protein